MTDPVIAWWRRLAIAGGVVSVALGVILLVWPKETLLVVAVLLGLWLVVSGAIKLVQSILTPEGRSGGARVLQALEGLLLLAVGVLCLRNIANSLALIAALVGVAGILAGAIEVWAAFSGAVHGWTKVGQVLIGVVTVLGGLVVLFWPGITLLVLVWLAGVWLLVLGLIQLFLARRVGKTVATGRTAT